MLCAATRVVLPEVAAAYALGGFVAVAGFVGPRDYERLAVAIHRTRVRRPKAIDHDPCYMEAEEWMFRWPYDDRSGYGKTPDVDKFSSHFGEPYPPPPYKVVDGKLLPRPPDPNA